MKKLFLLLSLALTVFANAQDEKTVSLTVSGQGATQDEARQKALRSAIEQAFGAFISSKTEILNDNLVKDEIVSVANGNIQKFEPVSEVQLPDGGYASTLKATVSVTKLTSFCESKGVEVEFKGAMFAMNIKLQKLNEESEYKAILNLCEISKEILSKSIDFSLNVNEPISVNGSSDNFLIKLNVNCKPNSNYFVFKDYFLNTISSIAMNEADVSNYTSLKLPTYNIKIYNGTGNPKDDFNKEIKKYIIQQQEMGNVNIKIDYTKLTENFTNYILRNRKSIIAINNLLLKSNSNLLNFRVVSEVDTVFVKKCCRDNEMEVPSHNIEYYEYNDRWNLNFKNGFPAAGRLVAPSFYFESTGKMILNFFNSKDNKKEKYMYDESKYFTSDETHMESYFGVSFINWFDSGTNTIQSASQIAWNIEPVIFSNYQETDFQFTYNHILPISKLEKISRYKIEPWINK